MKILNVFFMSTTFANLILCVKKKYFVAYLSMISLGSKYYLSAITFCLVEGCKLSFCVLNRFNKLFANSSFWEFCVAQMRKWSK